MATASVISGTIPSRARSLTELVERLAPGERVYLPGSTAEPAGLSEALFRRDGPPLAVTASYLPGVNVIPVERFPDGTTWTSMFAPPTIPGAQANGIYRHLPMSYGAFARHLRDQLSFDTCIVHVAPPDRNGDCSLGLAVELTPLAVCKSKRVLAVINPRMPSIAASASLPYGGFAAVAEIDAPLRTYDVGRPSGHAQAIASRLAGFIGDDTTVQIGLGKVPDALMACLVDRKRLRLFSGMLSDGARILAESSCLDPDYRHTCCLQLGTTAYYDWLADRTEFTLRGCEYTHDVATAAAQPRLVAVNSALSVDLFGQANLEMLDGHMVSGCGGAPDYARAATLSPGGVSIVALPSVAGRDNVSRVVSRLDGIGTLPRTEIDVVVTEHGIADLRGKTVIERGERLIAVAAPEHRSALTAAWIETTRRL